jgi:hypothetical protein
MHIRTINITENQRGTTVLVREEFMKSRSGINENIQDKKNKNT